MQFNLQKLEQVLNNKNEQFTKKVESLIEVWRQVCLYSLSKKIPYVVQLMDWAKFHTLNIVLNGDWKKFKGVINVNLSESICSILLSFRYLRTKTPS